MMGLSIRYIMTTLLSDTEAVRRLVADMRRLAIGLSFEKVGPMVESGVIRKSWPRRSWRGMAWRTNEGDRHYHRLTGLR